MSDSDYVLGTEEEEIARLGLQHRVWRARMLDGWARAGLAPGMNVIDVGAGPASLRPTLPRSSGRKGE